MRLATPPPAVLMPRHAVQPALLRAVATALSALSPAAMARALDDPGVIDLPDSAPIAFDTAQLTAAGPLYFASELERAGLLRTAELVTGLFASGAITQPLGPTSQLLHAFWRARRERLEPAERESIFARVMEAPHFDRLMSGVCRALVAEADGSDLHEGVALSAALQALGEFLAQRMDAMASIAAQDIVTAINSALAFLRDRMLQSAFGVHSLVALVSVVASQEHGISQGGVQRHVDRGRAGQTVLMWMAQHAMDASVQLDTADAASRELIMAAQRWLDSAPLQAPAAASPTLAAPMTH